MRRAALKATQALLGRILATADVAIDGSRAWDIRVADERFFRKVLLQGSLGLGEAYLRKWWACDDLEELFYRLINGKLERVSRALPTQTLGRLFDSLINQQTRSKSTRVAERHYNMGNDLFLSFLGKYKNYSCGYFEGVDALDPAQLQKMDKICRELDLSPRDRLLDVAAAGASSRAMRQPTTAATSRASTSPTSRSSTPGSTARVHRSRCASATTAIPPAATRRSS